MKKIVLASGNKGKLKEFAQMLSNYAIEIIPQSQFSIVEAEETGTTFIENAIIKARHAAAITKLPAIADDSGLEVDILDGEPGIFSARYAGINASAENNNLKLLNTMQGITHRKARFQCVLVYMRHAKDPTPIIAQASWEGSIALAEQGEKGHGYDPIFIPDNMEITAAEMNPETKNQVSHRAKALVMLIDKLAEQGLLN